ncbi:gamma-glutamyltranspeptidase/glutathione hydrolase [Arthrobacter pigmenti]|uniref:Gamma-glutamyltranspeptidase/glutathione hydrolase n=1 Tax=Arthrobacter pigmenti TaxID=271432 RepID=A0A846RS31_9MICC|nr:gamma-glutamyltransferase [Arthrobacter pigmenti]NJC23362.1 gamma-glutamyltranspeptidase/glutathione hydrolase [Arthrobacter pigmenti]
MRQRIFRLLAIAVCSVWTITACTVPNPPETAPTSTSTEQTTPAPTSTAPTTTAPTTEAPTTTPAQPHVQAVVSSNSLATDAGAEILNAGGTAADAAVAVAAVLTVVEPFYSSVLGGDTWALYYDAGTQEATSLNGVGPVGSKATLEDYSARAGEYGMHQAILPGAWDGWMLWLRDHGRLDLREVLAPAIGIARAGYPVSTEMTFWLTQQEVNIRNSPKLSELYLRNGALVATGQTVTQPDLADTLEALATAYDDGAASSGDEAASHAAGIQAARDYFYRGPLAEAIVAYSDEFGGYLTLEDFAGYEAEQVEPISVDWGQGLTVLQNPPNSQGIAMLLALNILKAEDWTGRSPSDPDVVHRQVEAVKLAYADRFEYIGDPDRTEMPVEELLSDEYAATQRTRIDMERAAEWPIEAGLDRQATDTTTFHVTDAEGNASAVTTSLGGQFLVVGDTGIHINERMKFMSTDPDNVNAVAPGATVRHTSNPYMVLRTGRPYLLGGNTGVDTQPQAQLQQFMNVVAFGLGPQEAVAQPRFVSTAFPASIFPYPADNILHVETSYPAATVENLRARGHNIAIGIGIFGTANMLEISEDGLTARIGAEPRNDTASGVVLPP